MAKRRSPRATSTFRRLLRQLARQYPSKTAFARALGIELSRLSRALGPKTQPWDVRSCLALAEVTGTAPGVVLRAAGRGDLAALIERLYGPARELLASQQRELLALYQSMSPSARESYLAIGRHVVDRIITTPTSDSGSGPLPPPESSTPPGGHVMAPTSIPFSRRVRSG